MDPAAQWTYACRTGRKRDALAENEILHVSGGRTQAYYSRNNLPGGLIHAGAAGRISDKCSGDPSGRQVPVARYRRSDLCMRRSRIMHQQFALQRSSRLISTARMSILPTTWEGK